MSHQALLDVADISEEIADSRDLERRICDKVTTLHSGYANFYNTGMPWDFVSFKHYYYNCRKVMNDN